MKITIRDIRRMFKEDTELYLVNGDRTLRINSLLLGTNGFSGMCIDPLSLIAAEKNKIQIAVEIPKTVFDAWCEYAEGEI